MSDLETKIKEISSNYAQLKKCQSADQKLTLCLQIVRLCAEAQVLIEKMNYGPDKFKFNRQVVGIKEKVLEISETQRTKYNQPTQNQPKQIENGGKKLSQDQLCRKIVRTIIEQEINSKHLSMPRNELEQLAVKMQQNLSVMEEIKNMIQDQGSNIEQVEQNIIKAYDSTVQANEELQEAAQIQLKTRLAKIRVGLGGVLGAVGYFFMGIPGTLLGLLGAIKIPKLLKSRN